MAIAQYADRGMHLQNDQNVAIKLQLSWNSQGFWSKINITNDSKTLSEILASSRECNRWCYELMFWNSERKYRNLQKNESTSTKSVGAIHSSDRNCIRISRAAFWLPQNMTFLWSLMSRNLRFEVVDYWGNTENFRFWKWKKSTAKI